jgi:hypothetical protein
VVAPRRLKTGILLVKVTEEQSNLKLTVTVNRQINKPSRSAHSEKNVAEIEVSKEHMFTRLTINVITRKD